MQLKMRQKKEKIAEAHAGDFRECRAFDTHNQIITDDAATSRGALQLLAELCAIDVPALLIRGTQRGARPPGDLVPLAKRKARQPIEPTERLCDIF